MGAMHRRDQTDDHNSGDAFARALEVQILEIELAHGQSDDSRWTTAVQTLRTAATEVGADRIEATATVLLTSKDLHPRCVLLLLGQLRSDSRILALEQAALDDERDFASELTSRRSPQERQQA